ncbi:molecular chaperone DnaJ [Haloarchaeobius sp. DFWS5]|uniref:molecular chaperone DnaJ n=1 Tax=Haloarchaeobius sp. DFWS5 TaxID=3446114 RepID=UPI003EB825ED
MLGAALLYVVGLAQYWAANADGFGQLLNELSAAGTDTAALQSALTGSRYGIAQPFDFVFGTGALVAEPPLPGQQWYGALAALVALPVLGFTVNRAWRASRPKKWVSINELVGVSLAVAIAAAAVGGPLLAGVVVMPFVFLVIIKHTRKSKNFRPSYLYVVGVSLPVLGLALDTVDPLGVDLLVLVVPLLTVVVLLLSAFVRPWVKGLLD